MNTAPETSAPAAPDRAMMNGKPVITIPAKSVINFDSAFVHKLLCDSLTFSTGSACVYTCCFCYVPDLMRKSPHMAMAGGEQKHEDIVIRRGQALDIVRRQLTDGKGRPKFTDPADRRVIYASPLVDVAGNMELVNETVAVCRLILELTHWHIRLLSKSNLLPKIATALEMHPELRARERIIYGVSTGTLQNSLARAFEEGTPLVSKRIESLHWLQDNGFRTFGMTCPSLPHTDYPAFAANMRDAIRADRCEHVWAEVINLRGDSFVRTHRALAADHPAEAELLRVVMNDKEKWEAYARATFEAHAMLYQGHLGADNTPKLRFLQYVTAESKAWWTNEIPRGAVLL